MLASKASACLCGNHYANLSNAAGPIITIPANTISQGRFVLGAGLTYADYRAFGASRLARLNSRRLHAHSLDRGLDINFNLGYGLTDDLTLSLVLPWKARYDLLTTDQANTINDGNSIGLGDISFLAKYRFYQNQNKDFALAALLGLKIPSGETNERNEFGFKLGSDDQPGTGSWDPLMGLAMSRYFDKLRLFWDTNFLYILSTPGKQGTIAGDLLLFNTGFSKVIDKISSENFTWSAVLEFNGQWQEKVESLGIKDPNHGGLIMMLSPGIKLNYKDRIYTNLYVNFPVIEDLNGEQSDLNIQLGYNINFLI